jgi:hypothetical protein
MTTYTFIGTIPSQFVNWDDPTVWSGGAVPNGATAEVIIPEITSSGSVYTSFISISGGQSFAAASVSITDNDLLLSDSLLITSGLDLLSGGKVDVNGGSLFAGSIGDDGFDIQGNGLVDVAGVISNQTEIIGNDLVVSARGFDNTGELAAASGNLSVIVASGGFANLSGSALRGGTYTAGFIGDSAPSTL